MKWYGWAFVALSAVLFVYLNVQAWAIRYLDVSLGEFWRAGDIKKLWLVLKRRYRERVGSALLRFSNNAALLKEKMPASLSVSEEDIQEIKECAWQIRTGESYVGFKLTFRFTRQVAKDRQLRPLVMGMQAEILELWKLSLVGLLLRLNKEIRVVVKVRD